MKYYEVFVISFDPFLQIVTDMDVMDSRYYLVLAENAKRAEDKIYSLLPDDTKQKRWKITLVAESKYYDIIT